MEARRRAPQAQKGMGGYGGRGSPLPRICDVELCRACSPIFWMALKYTSAASDRAVWGEGLGAVPSSSCPTLLQTCPSTRAECRGHCGVWLRCMWEGGGALGGVGLYREGCLSGGMGTGVGGTEGEQGLCGVGDVGHL